MQVVGGRAEMLRAWVWVSVSECGRQEWAFSVSGGVAGCVRSGRAAGGCV